MTQTKRQCTVCGSGEKVSVGNGLCKRCRARRKHKTRNPDTVVLRLSEPEGLELALALRRSGTPQARVLYLELRDVGLNDAEKRLARIERFEAWRREHARATARAEKWMGI